MAKDSGWVGERLCGGVSGCLVLGLGCNGKVRDLVAEESHQAPK